MLIGLLQWNVNLEGESSVIYKGESSVIYKAAYWLPHRAHNKLVGRCLSLLKYASKLAQGWLSRRSFHACIELVVKEKLPCLHRAGCQGEASMLA